MPLSVKQTGADTSVRKDFSSSFKQKFMIGPKAYTVSAENLPYIDYLSVNMLD